MRGKLVITGGKIAENIAGESGGGISNSRKVIINSEDRINDIKENKVNLEEQNISNSELFEVDNTSPVLEISYSTEEITDVGVVVTIQSNEELLELNGWNLSKDRKKLTKTYRNNTEEQTIIVYDLAGNATNVEIKEISNIDHTLQKAIQEVAYSFYMRGPNIQYSSMRGNPSWSSPEEATSQNMNYVTCSAFVKNVYYDLLGIKIPQYTENLIKYSSKYVESSDHEGRSEVIAYGKKEDGNFIMKMYDGKKLTNPTLKDIIPYLRPRRYNYIYRTYNFSI